MNKDSNAGRKKKPHGKIFQSIKNSAIISGLDRLCIKVYELLCSGAFARLFGARGTEDPRKGKPKEVSRDSLLSRTCEKISAKIETSGIVNCVNNAAYAIKGLRCRVIGTYLFAFAAFTAVVAVLSMFIKGNVASVYACISSGITAVTMAVAGIPFAMSGGTVSDVVANSKTIGFLVKILGFNPAKLWSEEVRGRHLTALILGAISGLLTVVIEPVLIFALLIGIAFIYIVLTVPEFGVVTIAFFMPFLPTMVLAGLAAFVCVAFAVKLIRGKRVLDFGRIDLFVLAFAVTTGLAGIVSMSTGSIMPALLFVCLISVYFMVSCCIRSAEWIQRIILATVTSAMIVSLYGIVQYAFGTFGANAWLDSDLFEGIAGRAVATLENPNMLGEYLVLILPMALALFLVKDGGNKKYSFMCTATMAMCLLLTWSRGAWLGFIFAIVVFLIIWSKRSMWIFAAGIISLPVLPFILPDSIINRFTSIGNMADSSTSYRVSIWRGAVHMLRDNFFSGIGVGESAWYKVYPDYTLPGIEAAPHSHNLFIQIALEQGIFGLIVFLIILFLLVRISFNLFARMTKKSDSITEVYRYNTRLMIAGPLCGLAGVLLQGLTDYSWYNYRVYLIFWLVLGLIPALVKSSDRETSVGREEGQNSAEFASVDIKLKSDE
ncbi:MAG: O-antigen ligase family protein [Clostridia bacterium]|nr:O-antigen ligase family protein [Clostridia bacterium]